MSRTLLVAALLLAPVPVALALLALAAHSGPPDDVVIGPWLLPEVIVICYGFALSLGVTASAMGEEIRRRGEGVLRLLLLPLVPLLACALYWPSFFLFLYRADNLPLTLGAAALTLVTPLGLLAYAIYARRHPVAAPFQPTSS